MAEQDDGAIRPEAFERIKQERDELKAQMGGLEQKVQHAEFLDKAYAHFKGREGVANPYDVAKQAVSDVRLMGVEPDKLGESLDGWYDGISSIFQPAAPPPEPEVPVADTAPAPAFARPNPAADGIPADTSKQMIETHSAEFRDALARNDKALIDKWDKEGLINWKVPAQ